jgi:hypothetical protein
MTIPERIYSQAITDGMPPVLATLIVSQSGHETDGWTSHVFTTCNNGFGYKYVGQATATGACTGSPEGDDYAKYSSIEQSTHELTLWIKRRQNEGKFPRDLSTINTPEQYNQLLYNAGYYGDNPTTYLNGLIYWLRQISGTLTTPTNELAILILLALGLIFRKRIFK